jgi:hypothetical protein
MVSNDHLWVFASTFRRGVWHGRVRAGLRLINFWGKVKETGIFWPAPCKKSWPRPGRSQLAADSWQNGPSVMGLPGISRWPLPFVAPDTRSLFPKWCHQGLSNNRNLAKVHRCTRPDCPFHRSIRWRSRRDPLSCVLPGQHAPYRPWSGTKDLLSSCWHHRWWDQNLMAE